MGKVTDENQPSMEKQLHETQQMSEQEWSIEHRKHGNEVYVVSSKEGIFVGEGYNKKERKRTHYLAAIIVDALNENDEAD